MGWSLFGGKKSGGTAPATKAQPAAATKGKAQAAPPAKGKTPATPAKTATPGAPGNDPNIKKASVCGDGISIANFERLSYEQWKKKAGNENKTIQDWRNAVVSALRNAKEGDAMVKYDGVSKISDTHADIFHSVADSFTDPKTKQTSYTSTESLENLFTGKVPGLTEFGSNKGYHSHRMPFWRYLKQKGLAYEGFWQHETSASWVNEAGKTIYADPSEIPYLVSNVAPIGTWVKVSTVDKDGNVLKSTYARILERGTNKAESSLKVYQNLGFSNVTPNADPTDWLKVETFEGSGDGASWGTPAKIVITTAADMSLKAAPPCMSGNTPLHELATQPMMLSQLQRAMKPSSSAVRQQRQRSHDPSRSCRSPRPTLGCGNCLS